MEKNELEHLGTDDIETENQIQENIIVEEPIIEHDVNYLGYGLIGISAVFLILTIIFSIIFKKSQLNLRKKSS